MKGTILIVEDERSMREALQEHLEQRYPIVHTASTLAEASESVSSTTFDGIVLDLHLPDGDGLSFLRSIRQIEVDIPVVVITAFPDVDKALAAFRTGACEFLQKPFDLSELDCALDDAVMRRVGLQTVPICVPPCGLQSDRCDGLGRIVGSSSGMSRVREEIRQAAAASGATVLITGESGTGKELVADALHFESNRCKGPFVAINCAGLAPGVLESELFGHAAGSFTGAGRKRPGLFAEAHQGTLFLDEIGELPLSAQPKLLRVLETRMVRPVGANTEVEVDIRLAAATNCNLGEMVQSGQFREDLYWRLAVVQIQVPPLREHIEDMQALAQVLLVDINRRLGRSVRWVSGGAVETLSSYDWPGNVRELRNVLERAVVRCSGTTVSSRDLPRNLNQVGSKLSYSGAMLPDNLHEAQLEHIQRVYAETGGNKSETARRLGITRVTLRARLRELGTE